MREIIFRGKTKGNGIWVCGDLRQYPSGKIAIKDDRMLHMAEVIPATVGQYTGLTDKNGKKIFEGDVLCVKHLCSDDEMHIVAFDDGAFGTRKIIFNGLSSGFVVAFADGEFGLLAEYTEVIGNIHDNPEMLKGGSSDGR